MADGIAAARIDLAAIDRRASVRLARLFADFEALVEAHATRQAGQAFGEGAQGGQADPPPDSV